MSFFSSKTTRSKDSKDPQRSRMMRRTAAGFSLFELLVSIAIFTVVTTIVLVKNSQFKGNVLVTNLAYQVALAAREAQVYGVSVSGLGQNSGANFTTFSHGYGIHFDQPVSGNPNAASSDSFFLFVDLNDDYAYSSPADSIVETFKTDVGYSVLDFCATNGSGTYCSDGEQSWNSATSATLLTALDMTFKRPSPNAHITAWPNTITGGNTNMSTASVTVTSSGGLRKTVQITSTGQISVVGE